MKKVLSLALCFAFGILALSGCSAGGESFEEKSYAPDVRVRGVLLDVEDREILVSRSDDERVHIKYFESGKEYYDISVSDEKILTMTSASGKNWTDYIGLKPPAENRKIWLQAPDAMLDSLVLSTTNEDISLSALAVAGDIHISSSGGSIAFDGLNVGTALTLFVKNGDISGTLVGNYNDFAIRSEVKKGKSNLPERKEGGARDLHVSGNNGDVHIEFIP